MEAIEHAGTKGIARASGAGDVILRQFERGLPGVVSGARSGEGASFPYRRIGWAAFAVDGTDCRLAVFWLNDYAGGIFIPFRDATSGGESYGAGRYLWDSAKGADLGSSGDELVLDFNYAYHPSCVYDPRWSCPLAPAENRLTVPIRAGERLAEDHA